uniref:Uncharacterized protein n=1 Tax=Heterorhabditis bacteriophora TaxID=37862 RepID=A0A1I7XBV7_HETBA
MFPSMLSPVDKKDGDLIIITASRIASITSMLSILFCTILYVFITSELGHFSSNYEYGLKIFKSLFKCIDLNVDFKRNTGVHQEEEVAMPTVPGFAVRTIRPIKQN